MHKTTSQYGTAARKEVKRLREDLPRVLDLPLRKHVDALPESKSKAKLNYGELRLEHNTQQGGKLFSDKPTSL